MRIKGLDFLRGIAIVGVLFRHIEIDFCLAAPGGYGVDLFFVLSGFLVSGLLFSEYKKRGDVNIKRFLIRRGFKIYPAFYFFILVSVFTFKYSYGTVFPLPHILSECFFLQSYLTPMWSHTWSLSVEEHFYFILAAMIFLAVKFRLLKGHSIPRIFAGTILLSFVSRIVYVFFVYRITREPFFNSHLRIDGLFTGALLGYLWHFKKEVIEKFYLRKRMFAFLAFLFIIPAFLLKPGSLFMVTAGFNLMHAGFSIIILLLISDEGTKFLSGNIIIKKISSAMAYIGTYSYSIYLWHLFVQNLLLRYVPDVFIESMLYLVLAVFTGIIASVIIEKPMLKIRDAWFESSY